LLTSYQSRFRFSVLDPGQTLEIVDVYENGTITGEFNDRGQIYRMYVSAETKEYGCNCRKHYQRQQCDHLAQFFKSVQQGLSRSESPLSKRIAASQFSTKPWNSEDFIFDSSLDSLRQLESVYTSAFSIHTSHELPPPQSLPEVRRIAWNLKTSGAFQLECQLQARNKRGNAWKRGQTLKFMQMFDDALPMTPNDLKVRRHFHYDYVSLRVDLIDAILNLIGAPNVLLNDEPTEVVPIDPTLVVVSMGQKEQFGFAFLQQIEWIGCKVNASEHGFILASDAERKVGVYNCQKHIAQTIRHLLDMQPVRKEHLSELFRYAEKFQSVLTVKLPENFAGPLVPEVLNPLIILRATQEGRIDYGIRVRDTSQKLQRPGQGSMIRRDQEGDRSIQRFRSAKNEVMASNRWANELNLTLHDWDGSCTDMAQSLQLLSKLREHSEELEVLWDPTTAGKPQFAGTVSAKNVQVSIERKRDWFQLSGNTTIGETSIPLASLITAIGEGSAGGEVGSFIRLQDDVWAEISDDLRDRLNRLNAAVHTERGALKFDRSSAREIRDLQSSLSIDAPKAWMECLARLEQAEKLDPQLPSHLNATLRDYQVEGFRWMRRLAEWGVGGILADDMGLGKTVQTLAVILDRASQGPCLVIAPTSVAFNWMREIERFAPSLQPSLYRETDRNDFLTQLGPNHVVVCSYGLALRDADKLKDIQWNTLILDEAQAIKNSRSKTAQAIASIPSDWSLALTGTPIENHLGELWSLFHVVAPGVFGGWDSFRNRFASPIERDGDEERRLALRNRIQPFVLRRTKGEVLRDLPARTESNLYVELSPAERKRYDQVRLSALTEALNIAKLPDIQDQRFKILALLTRLRQLACNPKLIDPAWSEGSAKLDLLRDTLKELKDEGHRVLVFSQFVQHLQLIRRMLEEEKISYQYLDGSTPADQRAREVDAFQNGDATVFLISLKAGGTGLNLTAADYVIHMDPWWNPAVEDQATDRAHRIGQTKPVIVYRIIAQGTIEEEILKLHDSKRDLIAGVLDGAQAAAKLSTEDLIAMIRQGS
ncbi:MAG: DEAD/DEAH box helicase, partial [Pirellula sp.]|nr:DEAD/DEAH box helicase [Pirellula sp.]